MKIKQRGVVIESLKGNKYRVQLQDHATHTVLTTLSGRMEKHRIILTIGDEVTVELSPYDLKQGRIIYRH